MFNPTAAKLHGVLVTFHRPQALARTLQALATQTRRLETLVIVDNGNDEGTGNVVRRATSCANHVEYSPAPENLGPAGGLALGSEFLLQFVDDSDWIIFLDDDNPPEHPNAVMKLMEFAEAALDKDVATAGVGLVGARFCLRNGTTIRVTDDQLRGHVQVDYVGGGQLPCYRATTMRAVGVPNPILFFGFDDLEYGLRVGEAGGKIYVDGDRWMKIRRSKGRAGLDQRPIRRTVTPGWRNYYSVRNIIWILRTRGRHISAIRCLSIRILGKSFANMLRSPSSAVAYLKVGTTAAFHAYTTSKMGRTIDPHPDSLVPSSKAAEGTK